MTIKAILIDLEGVLININYQKTFEKFAEFGINVNYDEKFKALVELYDSGQITTQEIYEQFVENYCPNKPLSYKEFVTAWNAMLLYVPDPNIEYLFRLKKQNIQVFLFSNINELHAQNVAGTYSKIFQHLFTAIIYSYQIHALKPTATSFAKALKILKEKNINRSEVIFVDDTTANINAAQQLQLIAEKYPTNSFEKGKLVFLRNLLEKHIPLKFFEKKNSQSIKKQMESNTNPKEIIPAYEFQ